MKHSVLSLVVLAATAIATAPVLAQTKADDHLAHHPAAGAAPAAAVDMADGEVRKTDKDAAKITIKHGEIKNLDMPPMTMVFSVRDKAMLDSVKAGDKVRFRAVNDAGKYTVTELQVVR